VSDVTETKIPSVILAGFFCGILTRQTRPDWSDAAVQWAVNQETEDRKVVAVDAEYYEWPLPRIAAIRNRDRVQGLTREMVSRAQRIVSTLQVEPEICLAGHSNGGVLAMATASALIERDWRVRSLVLLSPALPTRSTTRQIAEWIAYGYLGEATLVIAKADRALSLAATLPRVVTWPWGALGIEGWKRSEVPTMAAGRMKTVVLPNDGHSSYLNDTTKRRGILENVIGPSFGLYP
jgi:pimeloyl-ACP methyl ester carboxylesterase